MVNCFPESELTHKHLKLYRQVAGWHVHRFRRNFVKEPWVRVPRVHWEATTTSVITLEFLPGTKITDVPTLTAAGASWIACHTLCLSW